MVELAGAVEFTVGGLPPTLPVGIAHPTTREMPIAAASMKTIFTLLFFFIELVPSSHLICSRSESRCSPLDQIYARERG